MTGVSDREREWVRAAQSGDPQAFAEIWRDTWEYTTDLIRSRLRMSGVWTSCGAEDLAQETYIKAWKAMTGGGFRHDKPVQAWLSTIAGNAVRDEVRRQRRRQDCESVPGRFDDWADDQADEAASGAAGYMELLSVLDSLPGRQRTALSMRVVERCPIPEIAQVLGTNNQGARTVVHHARRAARALV